jgi:hypothetical protein
MKLNWVEKARMNNSMRALVQRSHEAPLLEQLVLEQLGGCVAGQLSFIVS